MATLSRVKTWISGDVLTASDLNAEFNNVLNDYNGGITNANISGSAAIAYSKLSLTGSVLNADLAGSIAASKISGTAATLSGTETLTNKTLTTPTVNQGTLNKPTVNASVHTLNTVAYSTTPSFNMDTSNQHIITLTGNATFSFANATSGQAFIIHVKQDSTGSRLVSWPAAVAWAGGSAPVLTSTANKVDSFGFVLNSSTYYGYILGANI